MQRRRAEKGQEESRREGKEQASHKTVPVLISAVLYVACPIGMCW